MVVKHTTEPIPHILDINPNLPSGIESVLEKARAKNRGLRYATASEVIADLAKLFPNGVPQDAEYTIPVTRRAPPQKNLLSAAEGFSVPRPWLAGMLLLLAAVLSLTGWQIFGSRAVSSPMPTASPVPSRTSIVLPPSLPTETASLTPSPALPPPTATFTATITPVPGGGGADKIALVSNKDIWVMDMKGRGLLQVTNSDQPKFDLQWLPGGKEILYGEGKCVKTVNVDTFAITTLTCLEGLNFTGFRVSPDGKQAAVTIERRVIVIPFDREALAKAQNAFSLQNLPGTCLDYANVTAKFALWSADSKKLAILHQNIRGQRFADCVRIIDISRCKDAKPLILEEFPNKNFTPEGCEAFPVIPAYDWNGANLFLLNTFVRNAGYGNLYLYDMDTGEYKQINPVENTCCYRDARFSPDGSRILVVFQDVRQGAESETTLYYLPIDQIGSRAKFLPIKLPPLFFPNVREVIRPALRPAQP